VFAPTSELISDQPHAVKLVFDGRFAVRESPAVDALIVIDI
jgi:hypothetical protein